MSTHLYWRPLNPEPGPDPLSVGMRAALARRIRGVIGETLSRDDLDWLSGIRDAGGSLTPEARALIDAIEAHGEIEFYRA